MFFEALFLFLIVAALVAFIVLLVVLAFDELGGMD